MAWYYSRHHADYRPLPPLRDDCRRGLAKDSATALTLIYPPPNSQVYLPTELDGKRQAVVFEAAHRTGNTTGFIDNVDVNAQDFSHFGADDAVAGIGSAAGTPDDHIGNVPFGKTLGESAGRNGQKYYQTKN